MGYGLYGLMALMGHVQFFLNFYIKYKILKKNCLFLFYFILFFLAF